MARRKRISWKRRFLAWLNGISPCCGAERWCHIHPWGESADYCGKCHAYSIDGWRTNG